MSMWRDDYVYGLEQGIESSEAERERMRAVLQVLIVECKKLKKALLGMAVELDLMIDKACATLEEGGGE